MFGDMERSKTGGRIQNTGRDSTYTHGSSSGTPSTEASPFDLRTVTPPATRNQRFQRSPAPSPDTPRVFNTKPKVVLFTDPTSPAHWQKAWLTAIHERLNFLDVEMAGLYI